MKEFEPFEIERGGLDEQSKTGICPLLRVDCIGERCMWWVRDWSEAKARFQSNCAVSLIAIGVNDEALQRAATEGDESMRR
jgi:hypothetical protein